MSAPVRLVKLAALRAWKTPNICSFREVLLGLNMKWSVGENFVNNQFGCIRDTSWDGLHHQVSPWQVSTWNNQSDAILGHRTEVFHHLSRCLSVVAQQYVPDLWQLLFHVQHHHEWRMCLYGDGKSALWTVDDYILFRYEWIASRGIVCHLWEKQNVNYV